MPFVYRRKPANIDRSRKREDEAINRCVEKAYGDISRATGSEYVKILPVGLKDPPLDKADPEKFLALYCTKILGLSMYEVEHWLDNMSLEQGFYLGSLSSVYFDERRKYYKRGGLMAMLSNSMRRFQP